jgi:hypothetical protein
VDASGSVRRRHTVLKQFVDSKEMRLGTNKSAWTIFATLPSAGRSVYDQARVVYKNANSLQDEMT